MWWLLGDGLWNVLFQGLEKSRRLVRDYEELPENHEGVVYIVMIRLMLRRLTDNQRRRLPQYT